MDRDDILPFRITLAEGECDRLGSMRLLPGMPVECFVQTGDRVVLSYLTKPLVDQVMRAFRQD
jgi:HlyD family secretion protein